MLQNFKQLKAMALEVEQLNDEFNGAYCSKDEKLFFIDHGVMYAVPWSTIALQILENNGFIRTKFKSVDSFTIPLKKIKAWDEIEKKFKEKSA